ncbi:YceI family protein [Ekhidna sp. To15]|uniref:YceI family protein n=1 Tax=Ekhidna sp. To15 TaxID=3395267 RepID=UPI003F51FA45
MPQLFLLLAIAFFQNPSLENAKVNFEVTHMGVLKVEGEFDELTGEFRQVGDKEWLIAGEVDVRSIDTDNDSRDETILTEQYLNAENYPNIPFEARLVRKGQSISLNIDLELRGIGFQLAGELREEDGVLISSPITFKRSDIGLDFGLMDTLIGDEIAIVINSGIGSNILEK